MLSMELKCGFIFETPRNLQCLSLNNDYSSILGNVDRSGNAPKELKSSDQPDFANDLEFIIHSPLLNTTVNVT